MFTDINKTNGKLVTS